MDIGRLLAVIAVLAVPAVVLAFTPLAPETGLFFVGVIPGLVASLHSTRLAVGAVVATGALVAAVELAAPWPWAAAVLMAVVGLAIGFCATRGWHSVAAAACGWPATLLISAPGVSGGASDVLAPALIALAGGLWAVIVGLVILKGTPRTAPKPLGRRVSAVYGLCLAAVLGVTTFIASTWFHGTTAGWILLTIFVVARPGLTDTNRRIIMRSVGTVAGGLAAALFALLVPVHLVHVLVGLGALVAAIAMQIKKTDYAVYAFTLTAAIVLVNSPTTDVLPVDLQRVLFTVVGAALTAAVVAVLQVAVRARLRKERAPAREGHPEGRPREPRRRSRSTRVSRGS